MNLGNVKKTSYEIMELENLKLDFSKEEIISNLKDVNCEDFIKIFSVINFDKIDCVSEAEILFYHLTNHSTPLREVVALKLEEIFCDEFLNDYILEQIVFAIVDINPNVCRAICSMISKSMVLKNKLCKMIIEKIKKLLDEITDNDLLLGGFFDNALKIRKNHAKNKKLFSLYWLLEALSFCEVNNFNSEVLEILNKTIKFNDYTIREKTAKMLVNIENVPDELLQIAKNDENFYVKNQVCVRINFED